VFVNDAGQRLRRLCPIVTVYGDPADSALLLAEVANGATYGLMQCGLGARAISATTKSLLKLMGKTPALAVPLVNAAPAGPVGEAQEADASVANLTSWWRRSASARADVSRRAGSASSAATPPATVEMEEMGSPQRGGPFSRRRSFMRRLRSMEAGGNPRRGGEDGEEEEPITSAWRRAAVAVSIVADEAARMTGMAPVIEWWNSRPSRAGSRKTAASRAGSLSHGMWRPRRSGTLAGSFGGVGGSFGGPGSALASRDDDRSGGGGSGAQVAVQAGTTDASSVLGRPYLSLGKR